MKENEQEVEPSNLAEELVLLQNQLANVLTEQSLKSVLSPKYELDAQKTLQDGVTKKLMTELTKFGAQVYFPRKTS